MLKIFDSLFYELFRADLKKGLNQVHQRCVSKQLSILSMERNCDPFFHLFRQRGLHLPPTNDFYALLRASHFVKDSTNKGSIDDISWFVASTNEFKEIYAKSKAKQREGRLRLVKNLASSWTSRDALLWGFHQTRTRTHGIPMQRNSHRSARNLKFISHWIYKLNLHVGILVH